MTVTILIILICILLYKSGKSKKALEKFKLNEESENSTDFDETTKDKERIKLEKLAYNILDHQNFKHPESVKLMNDELLTHIIREFYNL